MPVCSGHTWHGISIQAKAKPASGGWNPPVSWAGFRMSGASSLWRVLTSCSHRSGERSLQHGPFISARRARDSITSHTSIGHCYRPGKSILTFCWLLIATEIAGSLLWGRGFLPEGQLTFGRGCPDRNSCSPWGTAPSQNHTGSSRRPRGFKVSYLRHERRSA